MVTYDLQLPTGFMGKTQSFFFFFLNQWISVQQVNQLLRCTGGKYPTCLLKCQMGK